jgi:fumarate reductase flavoprotein subunit
VQWRSGQRLPLLVLNVRQVLAVKRKKNNLNPNRWEDFMAAIERSDNPQFEISTEVLIIGAGCAGLVAALRANEAGASVLVLERDALPRGSTALSAGLIPAAGTRFQKAAGISDSEIQFAQDIIAKAHGEPDGDAVRVAVAAVGLALEWLHDKHGLPFSVIENFTYPGHSACRMHGLPSRSGGELMDRLRAAAEAVDIDILTNAQATTMLVDMQGAVKGMRFLRPNGTEDSVGCGSIILACNGYGGNKARVKAHIPQLADALYFGHSGNQGEALAWGEALGAKCHHLSGHQGHGSVAYPQGILITWATMVEGGFQVNKSGQRFSDESHGYSEQAEAVLAQDTGTVWSIFDNRIAGIARQFEDFRNAEAMGAIISAESVSSLASKLGLPEQSLGKTFNDVSNAKSGGLTDAFGRNWSNVAQLEAPYLAVKVTGALFHTQGGLLIDELARVQHSNGTVISNLFAVGGAACGVSGSQASGYLSGNGLLTAVALGYIAGAVAGQECR